MNNFPLFKINIIITLAISFFFGNSTVFSQQYVNDDARQQSTLPTSDLEAIFYFKNDNGYQLTEAEANQSSPLSKDAIKGKNLLNFKDNCAIITESIGDNIELIVVNSDWYIDNWNNNPKRNDDCEVKTRAKLMVEIEGELKKNKHKTIIFAMYHPVLSYGKHGRAFGAFSQNDRYNEQYDALMSRIEILTKDHNRLFFVSSNDASLQYIVDGETKQLVVGAKGASTSAGLGQFGQFSYKGEGFAKVYVYKNGSSYVQFYKEDETSTTPIYSTQIIPPTPSLEAMTFPTSYPETMKASVYDESRTEKTGFYKSVWGDHYRKVYGTEVSAKVALLDTLYGGLKVVRPGGGHQTVSLRLEAKDGKTYNMRALEKSAVQFLQTVVLKDKKVEDGFRNTIPEDLILDFYTAAHPYGAFAIPKLADAADVFHTNPKLYFVPRQEALGKYNDLYAEKLYMIVERPDKEYDGALFDFADDVESTDDLLDKLRSDEENVIDEQAYIRARLFDMLIGDWDRHNDQWRWAEYKNRDGKDVFVPIPRDRDQVFANFDGGFLNVLRTLFDSSRQFQVYGEELKNTKWMNTAGVKLDKAVLENSDKAVWIEQAKFLQENITDAVIEQAFRDLPTETQDATANEIKTKLKGRRGNMVTIAEDFYDYFSRQQTITGTDKDDHFEITRMTDGKTNIKSFRIKDGKKADKMTDRTYSKDETKEIWIYGLDDDDVFEVNGRGDSPIFIRIIGGQNNDIYRFTNGRNIKVYDHKSKKNTIETKAGARFKLTDNYNMNTYNYMKQKKATNVILPSLGFNPDDGIRVGLADTFTVFGFLENPFAQQHRFNVGYYGSTQSFDVSYEGEFANVFGNWNFLVGGMYQNPSYSINYFGFGNETDNLNYDMPDNFEREFNQVRVGGYGAHFGIKKDTQYGSAFQFTGSYQAFEVEDTANRFIALAPPTELEETKSFATLKGNYTYESFDNKVNPTRGLKLGLEAGGTMNVEETDAKFGFINPTITMYNALTKNRKFVLKTRALGQIRIGDDFEFYQAATIGGQNGLRGYRDERFTGKNAAIGSADIRYSFNRFQTALTPVQIGVFAGADAGRVWIPNQDSDTIHTDFGGGFWINAVDSVSGTFNIFTGEEGLRFTFNIAVSL